MKLLGCMKIVDRAVGMLTMIFRCAHFALLYRDGGFEALDLVGTGESLFVANVRRFT